MAYDGFLTNPPSGGGALELVETIEVIGAAVGVIDFQNLDGDVDSYYEITGQVELTNPGAPGGADRLLILPNGFTSVQETVLTQHIGLAGPAETSNARLTVMRDNTRQTFAFRCGLWAKLGNGTRGFFAECIMGATAGNQDRASAKGVWNNEASNIVNIEVMLANNANGQVNELNQFTQMTLWKRPF